MLALCLKYYQCGRNALQKSHSRPHFIEIPSERDRICKAISCIILLEIIALMANPVNIAEAVDHLVHKYLYKCVIG